MIDLTSLNVPATWTGCDHESEVARLRARVAELESGLTRAANELAWAGHSLAAATARRALASPSETRPDAPREP